MSLICHFPSFGSHDADVPGKALSRGQRISPCRASHLHVPAPQRARQNRQSSAGLRPRAGRSARPSPPPPALCVRFPPFCSAQARSHIPGSSAQCAGALAGSVGGEGLRVGSPPAGALRSDKLQWGVVEARLHAPASSLYLLLSIKSSNPLVPLFPAYGYLRFFVTKFWPQQSEEHVNVNFGESLGEPRCPRHPG